MKLVSSNLSIEAKSYDRSTLAYQKRIFGSTSNDHNSSYTIIWVRYYISMERYESPISNEIGFIQFDIGVKCYGWSTSDYQNSSPKDRLKNYLIFRGVLVIPPLPKSVQTLY